MTGSQLQWRMYIENAFQLAVELLNVLVDGRRLVEDVEWRTSDIDERAPLFDSVMHHRPNSRGGGHYKCRSYT